MLSVAAFLRRAARPGVSRVSDPSAPGAPVVAFCRIADKEIRLREPILEPDCLIVQDPTLFKVIDVFAGLSGRTATCWSTPTRPSPNSISAKSSDSLPKGHAVIVPATEFALKHVGRPVPNAALLGAFAALTQFVHLDSVERAIERGIPRQDRRRQHRRRAGSAMNSSWMQQRAESAA